MIDAVATSPSADPRRAILALILLVPAPSVAVVMAMIVAPGAVGTACFLAAKAWMIVLPAAWLLLVDKGRPGLSRPRHGGFGAGIATGVAISAVIFAAYFALGSRWIDAAHVAEMATQNGIGSKGVFLGAAAYWVLVNSVVEEYVYRWFIFRKLETLMPGRWAVLGSALFFTVHHVIALKVQFDWVVTMIASLGIFVGGALWSGLYLRYRSIWPGYVSHAIVDVAVFGIGWRIIFG